MTARIPLPDDLSRAAFRTRDALRRGVGGGRLRGPDLVAPISGTRISTMRADLHERCRAALLVAPNAAIASASTMLLLGAPLPFAQESGPVHLAVATNSGEGPRRRGVVTHRHTDFAIVQIRGLPSVSVERAWCELAQDLRLDDLVAVGDFLLHHQFTTTERLRDVVTRSAGTRGVARMREALPLLDARAESRRESRLRVLVVTAGIEGFVPNLEVRVGRYRHRIDLAFPREMVALEYQGDHHRDPEQWQKDQTRRARLESAGWLVIEITAEDLRDPADLLRRIRMALEARR